MVGGGWVKSHLRTRIARLVPSTRRLTHLSLVSSSQFYKYLSLFSRFRSPRRSLAGRSRGGFPLFSQGIMHILKSLLLAWGKRGAARSAPLIPKGINNEHYGKALWPRENHTFEGGSTVFIFFHFLSFSFMFLHVLYFSFIFLSFSLHFLYMFFTFSLHFLSFFLFFPFLFF